MGILIIYGIFHLIPGDPIEALLPSGYNEIQYVYMANSAGFEYNPLLGRYILRFSNFLGDLLMGAWGWSGSLNQGASVYDLIFENNTILHAILLCVLPLIIGTFYMIKKSRRKSIVFDSLVITILLSAAFILYAGFGVIFNIRGFGKLLVDAIIVNDHYPIAGCLFFLLILYLLTTLTSNIIFSIHKLRSSKSIEVDLETNSNGEIISEKEF